MNGALAPAAVRLTGQMRRPARLRPGSRVAVVAPSGRGDPDLLAAGCRILTGWGLDVHVGPHALTRHPALSYLAGADADRAADLEQAWLDPDVEAVLCARGGYGAQRIVDRLDWAAMAAVPPKIFSGFSDVTALHEAFALRLRVATLHSPNIWGDGFTGFPGAAEALRQALFDPDAGGRTLASDPAGWLAPGRATGVTAGGNLSMLAANLGTLDGRDVPPGPAGGSRDGRRFRASVGFAGCLLLLEDVNEDCYRLDRMLTQLLRSGALDGVAGIALGTWTGCNPAEDVPAVLADRLAGLGVPVAWGLGFGHTAPQPTIPLGVPAELDSATGTLTFLEPAVS
ncbi:MAG TPA: LD-carboxypeptidase [Streptosporangiaceae bacterium]|jgi:muramoyltetrapeptide carboxypeptidase|nr:LD-carboxypeptidase [Streptosporangiaceae bacterium]